MAMFTSTEPAKIQVPFPSSQTTSGAGGVIAVAFENTLSNVRLLIFDGSGAGVNFTFADAPPANVTATDGGYDFLDVVIDPAFFVGKVSGMWRVQLRATGFPEQGVCQFQWGGTIDALLTAAQNADSQSYRTQQTVQGNSTWDHTTGTVGITSTGESFQLANEAGTPVSDQALAVRRVNSTVG